MKTTALALLLLCAIPSLSHAQEPDLARLIDEIDPGLKRVRAAEALGKLGPKAAPAVPSLRHVLTTSKDFRLVRAVVEALAAIGEPASGAVRELRWLSRVYVGDLSDAAIRAIEKIQGPAVKISSAAVNSAHEGKPVQVRGVLRGAQDLRDPEFNVAVPAARLKRIVERFQWVQQAITAGTRNRKKTVYTYVRLWESHLVESQNFRKEAGHKNPPWAGGTFPIKGLALDAGTRLGAFKIESSLVQAALKLRPLLLPKGLKPVDLGLTWKQIGDAFYATPADPSRPKLGDFRVRFVSSDLKEVVVTGIQRGDTIHPR
ncbi:MAG: HEAT repeat domain-containing protein [Planctomycetes bacterium]|nr:HEAT repeat domain-containing protein [Planctomycetota bacterium]